MDLGHALRVNKKRHKNILGELSITLMWMYIELPNLLCTMKRMASHDPFYGVIV